MRSRTMIAAMVAAATAAIASPAMNYAAQHGVPDIYDPLFFGTCGRSHRPARGKHKPRRHGQKLKSCRVKIGRRVRRKHRRAAA